MIGEGEGGIGATGARFATGSATNGAEGFGAGVGVANTGGVGGAAIG